MFEKRKWLACTLVIGALTFGTAVSLADGPMDWHSSSYGGGLRFANYAYGVDGYLSVDGMGGTTAADYYFMTVISRSASIWAQPRTGSQKIASVKRGDELHAVNLADGSVVKEKGFYQVEYKGQIGWVNESYVVLNKLDITLMESNVPAYIAPDTRAKKVGSLSKQTTYRVIGFYDDFYIINLYDAAAYIPMSTRVYDTYFSANYQTAKTYAVTTSRKTSLRTGPDTSYPEIRTIGAGTKLSAYDDLDGWHMVWDEKGNTWAFISGYDAN